MQEMYKALEEQMVKYKDLVAIPVVDNQEPLVSLARNSLIFEYMPEVSDMKAFLKGDIYVRSSVSDKLENVQRNLLGENPGLSLFVTYGYRSLDVQTMRFLKRLAVCAETFYPDPTDLYEAVHRSVAVPTVAGHPTGGAIDIAIFDTQKKQFLEFGTRQYDYSTKDYYVFSSNVSSEATQNRLFLRELMTSADFVPFDGEWWHFSYGDKEWAFYRKKEYAIYDQLSEEQAKAYVK